MFVPRKSLVEYNSENLTEMFVMSSTLSKGRKVNVKVGDLGSFKLSLSARNQFLILLFIIFTLASKSDSERSLFMAVVPSANKIKFYVRLQCTKSFI